MSKRCVVTLTERERTALAHRPTAGSGGARDLAHARILLKADAGSAGPARTDGGIASALDVSVSTVERVRERFVERGLEAALRRRRPRRECRRKLDAEQEAHLIAPACTPPPVGRRRWTRRPLAGHLVELRHIDRVSCAAARQVRTKNRLRPWLPMRWCISPEQGGELVRRMEDILEVYTRPYDPRRPLLCLHECRSCGPASGRASRCGTCCSATARSCSPAPAGHWRAG
jgi:hypothetical protein